MASLHNTAVLPTKLSHKLTSPAPTASHIMAPGSGVGKKEDGDTSRVDPDDAPFDNEDDARSSALPQVHHEHRVSRDGKSTPLACGNDVSRPSDVGIERHGVAAGFTKELKSQKGKRKESLALQRRSSKNPEAGKRRSKSKHHHKSKIHNESDTETDSDSDASSLTESSTSSSSSSDPISSSSSSSTSSSDHMEKRHRQKPRKKRSAKKKGSSSSAPDDPSPAEQIKALQDQLAQLTQLCHTLQRSAFQPANYGFGTSGNAPYLVSQTGVVPTAGGIAATAGATLLPPLPPLPSMPSLPPSASESSTPLKPRGNQATLRGRGRGRGLAGFSRALDVTSGKDYVADDGKSPDGKKKRDSSNDYKRVDWVWDSSLYTWKLQDSTESSSDAQYEGYIFHVRRSFDIEGKYRATTVDIKSKPLREGLQDVIGDIKGVSLVDESPKTDPNLLFLYLEDIRAYVKKLKNEEATGDTKKERKKNAKHIDTKRKHLKTLVGYLDEDYAKTKESLYPMLENGLITFDLLWALWKPGTFAFTTTYGSSEDPRVFKVELAEKHKSFMKGELYHIDGKYFEFDGKKFGYGTLTQEIMAFKGARRIDSLACYPIRYHSDENKLRGKLITRGKKFASLSGVHYKSYSGLAYHKTKKGVVKFNIQQSRIMVDPAIFRRINPNYYISPVSKSQQQALMLGGGQMEDDCECDSEETSDADGDDNQAMSVRKLAAALNAADDSGSEMSLEQIDVAMPKDGLADTQGDKDGQSSPKIPTFTDEDYLIASPVVFGFAFSEKQWLEFGVESVGEIVWNDTAWDSLVSEPETKDLVQALVKSRKYHAANTIDDVIQGKGKGLVTVLHGPPGTGKTLTAEGISELLKCPLYMASAGELGTDSRRLEAELQKMLDICHAWGAILLLDEADVFLEKRNMTDIHRNALVSIFLRQLEYFQGILFLTTNRVETFDEAFQSRIHIALRYGALEAKAKKAIFKMFIDRVRAFGKLSVAEFTDDDLDRLARKDLNGREIKNVVSSAQDLAVNKDEAMSMLHIQQVLEVHAKFGRDLKGGEGFEDAMRSYF